MLDTDTKRRIDTARDILVGKVPDPKSQVEQITIAMIYKFMDDMDAESEEFGGQRKFFAGDYARYGWAKLMHSGLGGHETLNLYAEAIGKMPENPGVPSLFRDIFKNAYLPYRDPETLRAFLKIIDGFSYDHSERLGDAFEYLLSVLGSQGDAGQFRTPRHIIDFMVEILDPKKGERVLDPACGTAGFLISAYKHIMRANSDGKGGSNLTPDEKGALAKNFFGYDISPDMVRLSLVNMYLHGFTDPHIYEYDTLTSQDRWNEQADVILANPPFMSPKGGIIPHNRFSVQSKRSEVLFVDYMAEHLSPNGRAAIIVPEGVIFQSQTAYKQLRKMLVEEFLVAVISLPAGIFNPYSGVKTSILVLDRGLAKRSKTVGFFKVENDGFGLGAQRREIEKNDLPGVKAEMLAYMMAQSGESAVSPELTFGRSVAKARIAEEQWNLSGERYADRVEQFSQYDLTTIGDVCQLIGGATPSKENPDFWSNGVIKWISSKHIDEFGQIGEWELISESALKGTSTKLAPAGSTIIITRVSVGKFAFADSDYAINQDLTALVTKDPSRLDPTFVRVAAHKIATIVAQNAEGIGVRGVTRDFLSKIQIPVPPLEVQREIVAEIEGYQRIITAARTILENYHPKIPLHPDWPTSVLSKHFATASGGTPSKAEPSFWIGAVPWVSPKDMKTDIIVDTQDHISETAITASSTKLFPAGTVVCVVRSGILKHSLPLAMLSRPMCINQDLIAFLPKDGEMLPKFLFFVLKSSAASILAEGIKPGVTVESFHSGFFKDLKIPLPTLEIQQKVVAEIETEQALVAANRELIKSFEVKIQKTLARVWGEASAGVETPTAAPVENTHFFA